MAAYLCEYLCCPQALRRGGKKWEDGLKERSREIFLIGVKPFGAVAGRILVWVWGMRGSEEWGGGKKNTP